MTDLKRRILIAAALAACGLHGAVAPAASAAEIPAYAPLPPAGARGAGTVNVPVTLVQVFWLGRCFHVELLLFKAPIEDGAVVM